VLFDLQVFPEFRNLNSDKRHVVFDANSTRLLLVDDILLTVLLHTHDLDEVGLAELRLKCGQTEDIERAIKVMQELVQVHMVLKPASTPYQTAAVHNQTCRAKAVGQAGRPKIGNILLNVSTACQLACRYCFAEGGHYGHPQDERMMPWEVARAAIDMLDFRDVEGHSVALGFFGGEPLLNWSVVEQSIRHVNEVTAGYQHTKVFYNMTTNGVGLTQDRARVLQENKCTIMFSIDGCESTHNNLRPARSGENSWQVSVQNYMTWLALGGWPLTARTTITAKDTDLASMHTLLRDLGFGNINTQLVQTEDKDLKLTVEQLHQYTADQVKLLADDVTKSADMQRIFGALLQGRPRLGFCGVGQSGFAVQPNGDMYLCHRFASDDNFKIGHVFRGVDTVELAKHRGWLVSNSLVCSRCWARHICAGGCYAENYVANKDPLSPRPDRCYLTKSMVYHAIEHLVRHSDAVPYFPLQSLPEC